MFSHVANGESPEFAGRVVAALAREPDLMERTGKVSIGAALATEFGISDVDGRRPSPLGLETA